MMITTKTTNKMKKHIQYGIIAAVALTGTAVASAQNRSAYFLDNYQYNYQLNPAFGSDFNGMVSLPALGNLNFGVNGNVGVKNFIYPLSGGRTATFLHPEVDAGEFLGGLKNNNRLQMHIREGIVSVGFKALGGYNNVSVNAVANANMRLPKGLFSFLKNGISNETYDIGRADIHADAYAEIALNHSRSLEQLLPGLRVGASVKFLLGVANIDVNMDRADLQLGTDSWNVVTDGTMHLNMGGVSYKTRWNNDVTPGRQYVDGVDFDSFKAISGFGLAFDLGASYRLNSDWEFALAFNDIGFISWSHDVVATTNGERTFRTSDHVLNPDDIDESFDQIKNDLSKVYQLTDEGDKGGRTRALEATMNVSAEYTLPVYRNLKFGLLNTTRMARRYSWTEFRLSANVQPVKCIGLGINYGIGTFGSSFGWILNIAPKGFNFYVGMDHTLGKLAKQGIPLNSNAQLSLGFNFPF